MKVIAVGTLAGVLLLFGSQQQTGADQYLRRILQHGEPVPGATDKTFLTSSEPSINNLGQVALKIEFSSPEYNRNRVDGIWTSSQTRTGELIVAEKDPVPGRPEGSRFSGLGTATINDSGQVVISGSVDSFAYGRGVWLFDNGELLPVAVLGQQPPVFETGRKFHRFSDPVLNDSGDVAFHAEAYSLEPRDGPRGGLWFFRDGSLDLVAEGTNLFGPTIGRYSLSDSGTLVSLESIQ